MRKTKSLTMRQRAKQASNCRRAYQIKLRAAHGTSIGCEVCGEPLASSLGGGARVCSPRCMTALHALDVLELAIKEGRAAGLKDRLLRLARLRAKPCTERKRRGRRWSS